VFSDLHIYGFDRKEDRLLLLGNTLSGEKIDSLHASFIPESVAIEDQSLFLIDRENAVSRDGTLLGHLHSKKHDPFVAYSTGDTLTIVTGKQEKSFTGWHEGDDMVSLVASTGDVYWRAHTQSGEIVYKNGEPFSQSYPRIHAYAISAF